MSELSLSSLDRAALSDQKSYWWIHGAAGLYCLVIGAFSVVAWVDAGEPFRAAICGFAQVLAIVCAILARRAFTSEQTWAGFAALIFAAGCAWWAAQGLGHAWSTNGEPLDEAMVYFLCGFEPGLFILAEHIQEGADVKRKAFLKAEREEREELRRIRDKQDREDLARAGTRAHGFVPRLVDGVKMVAGSGVAVAPGAADAQMLAHSHGPLFEPAGQHSTPYAGLDAKVAEACRLRDQGMTRAEVADAMRCSERTITRRWGEAEQANKTALASVTAPAAPPQETSAARAA